MIPIGTKLDQITAEQLRHRLHYAPETGVFTWRTGQSNYVGKTAGWITRSRNHMGYFSITLHGKTYKAHRLAHLWMTGAFPVYQLSHKDGDCLNNKWDNLIELMPQENDRKAELTQEYLKSRVDYNSSTGIFTWKLTISDLIGKPAGNLRYTRDCPYWEIGFYGKSYMAHRLVFLYMTGSFPVNQVDHIDGNGLNNRWENLRDVTHTENRKNDKLHRHNTSGTMGVSYCKLYKKWRARIGIKGKHLGYFESKEKAISARKKAELEFGFHPNHGKR